MPRPFACLLPLLLLSLALPASAQRVPCTDGAAGDFPCQNVDLMAFMPIAAIDGDFSQDDTTAFSRLNDIWGWTDPETGREYALVGRSDGTAFVDITDPVAPVYLGSLPPHGRSSLWRDLKTYGNHVFIVSEAFNHGMQVFDLTQLRDVENPPVTFDETAHYARFGDAHNIVINEETGFAYAVGLGGQQDIPADYPSPEECGPGLHIVNVQEPANPEFAGCFSHESTGRAGTGYTHDAQCVVYRGPDADYEGREVCFNSNETALSIADVTDKAQPEVVSSATYPQARYVHQGWLTEDQRYFLQDDELDESAVDAEGNPIIDHTRTIVWDLADLDDPVLLGFYFHDVGSIDHNQYIRGNYSFQANYTSGLRILDLGNSDELDVDDISLAGYFDTYPATDAAVDPSGSQALYDGAWSNYPFFESGNVVVSSIAEGLFVLQPDLALADDAEAPGESPSFDLASVYPNPAGGQATIVLANDAAQPVTVELFDLLGRRVRTVHTGTLPAGTHHLALRATGLPAALYVLRAQSSSASVTRRVTVIR